MKLYVLRHGPAEDHAESGVDADRALTASGRERVRAVARALEQADETPVLVFTSPLARAVQTAEIVALVTKIGDRDGTVEVRRELAPGGHAVGLARHLAAEGRKRVMFVGHEPDLSGLVGSLLGAFGHPFDKAMVVSLQVATDRGRSKLRFVLDPRTLALHPDHRA